MPKVNPLQLLSSSHSHHLAMNCDSEIPAPAAYEPFSSGHWTINGGIGGPGGEGGQLGGTGGPGEGPRFQVSNVEKWKLQVNGNLLNHLTAADPTDYRRIPMGDINLQGKLISRQAHKLHGSPPRRKQTTIRKLYSAKIEGKISSYTVALYQGHNADEIWRADVAQYMAIRHPNVLQIYGVAQSASGNFNATVFHNDHIHLLEFEDIYRHRSPMVLVYIYAAAISAFNEVEAYLSSVAGHDVALNDDGCTLLMCRSTGRLCVDIWPPGVDSLEQSQDVISLQENLLSSTTQNQLKIIGDTLSFGLYHHICETNLATWRRVQIRGGLIAKTMNLGSIVRMPSNAELETSTEVALLPNPQFTFVNYECWEDYRAQPTYIETDDTANCIRISSDEAAKRHKFHYMTRFDLGIQTSWLSQANYIFEKSGITSNLENYVLLTGIRFQISISPPTQSVPEGFLFLQPGQDYQLRQSSFRWPEYPAYWSLDQSGIQRLGKDEAAKLGFPALDFSTTVLGSSWDGSVYAGLRDFHHAKGFDSNGQDLAIHLGEPLYCLCGSVNVPCMHQVCFDRINEMQANENDCPAYVYNKRSNDTDTSECVNSVPASATQGSTALFGSQHSAEDIDFLAISLPLNAGLTPSVPLGQHPVGDSDFVSQSRKRSAEDDVDKSDSSRKMKKAPYSDISYLLAL
ncbi:hypothetical protein R3P38DRAFT_1706472 [Favolaschia claudopus]|uniref:Protein kinase domain-containing protein n=1 Tax=Favolaschia claudopus TaxID=2862362 RepID=A0AAW0ABD3_9AGAR